jgi:hypothetical protein
MSSARVNPDAAAAGSTPLRSDAGGISLGHGAAVSRMVTLLAGPTSSHNVTASTLAPALGSSH